MKRTAVLVAALMLGVGTLAYGVVQRYRDNHALILRLAASDHHQCRLILRLNGVIIDSLVHARNAPLPRYYLTHPREARIQLRALDREIADFRRVNCKP